jgi:beta-lactamase regulating signal transducer with metallopeptidase domain/DUF4097 and DUF4098 domain-containing protein YvlB
MTLFVLKLTLLLTSGATLAVLLRHRSAATRHFAWALTLIGALLFAVVAAIGPRIEVTVPDWRTPALIKNVSKNVPATAVTRPHVPTTGPVVAPSQQTAPARMLTPVTVWAMGVAAMLAWLLIGHLGLARIARKATTAPWTALIDEVVADSGVTRPVRVVLSELVLAPMTWGWRHPLVLLPAEAASWPSDRRRAALMHELAHVARNDYLTQLFASLACALYWFHPFAWFSLRRLRRESEQASDDRVLTRGLGASDYATHLVDVAVAARARRFGGLLALGMACPSHLETRLRALLDETRARNGVSRRLTAIAVAVAALILVPLAAARPELRAARQSGKPIDFERVANRLERAVTRPIDRTVRTIELLSTKLDSKLDEKPRGAAAPSSVAASPGETLVLDLETGGSVEVRGWDEARVAVEARLGGRDAKDTNVDVERMGDGVRLHAWYGNRHSSRSSSHEFVIHVPGRFNVSLDSAGGGLSIENVEGVFRGTTGGGDLNLRKVKGRAELSTGGGEIEVSDVELDGHVSTGGGQVTLSNVRGGLRGSSGSGPVIRSGRESGTDSETGTETRTTTRSSTTNLTDSESVTTYMDDVPAQRHSLERGAVQIEKAGGNVELDDAPHGAVISTGGGSITVGAASDFVDASTGGGRIEIGPVAGSVHASTGAGDVVVTLVDPAGREQTVEIFTGSGDVEVVLPATLDAKFEIETAYTRPTAPTHIDSTWELEHQPVTGWDTHEGTARRYVRASGSAGNGRGLVRIKAVNGNVTLRRAR